MATEIFVYGFIALWVVVVVTHGLTIAFCEPKVEVVEVREIIRKPSEIVVFREDFLIDQHDALMFGDMGQEFINREMVNAKARLFYNIPDACFTIYRKDSIFKQEIYYTVILEIMPPKIK